MVTHTPIVKRMARWILAAGMVGIGLAHFFATEDFVRVMPAMLPLHRELVWVSGFFEILGGIGLVLPLTRRWAGWGLMALYICVFPANINMAILGLMPNGVDLPLWLLWARLPLQGVLIVWAFWVSRPDRLLPSEEEGT